MVKSLGVKMKEVEIPDFPYGALIGTIIGGEAGSIFEDLIRSGKVDQLADKRQIAGSEGGAGASGDGVSEGDAHPHAGAGGVPEFVRRCRHAAGAVAAGAALERSLSRWIARAADGRSPSRAG